MKTIEKSAGANARRRRIQKVSGFMQAFFLGLVILQIVLIVVGVIAVPLLLLHGQPLKSQATFKNGYSLLLLPFALMVTLNFLRLFSRLKEGHLFEAQTIKLLETAGKWWIALGALDLTFQFWEGFIYSRNSFAVTGGQGIFAGLVIFFIAWVLREAQELKEEQALTV
jgi:hypothetical protein